jgi:cytosine/adenosine deaminase-related metal-dependent hydrolase
MAEILLKNLELLLERSGRELKGVDVLINERRIAEIGPALPHALDTRVIDCRGKIGLPGLVNTHHHFFQILTRCLHGAQDAPLFEWLAYHYPIWKQLDAESFYAAARLAIAELLLTGCTTTADHLYLFPQDVTNDLIGSEVQAARELGIRLAATRGAMSLGKSHGGLPPDDVVESEEKILRHSEECIRRYHDPSPLSMCQVHLAPCSPFNVTRELMLESAKLARAQGVRLHTHLSETRDELDYCRAHYRCTPLELMEDVGWVGNDVWFAHGVYFSTEEIKRLAATGTGIAHCPSSNMRLASGIARVPDLIEFGVPVGLGVDGSASNDSSDMLGELRQALLLNRSAYGVEAMSARQVINMATEGSAKILGRNEIGSLEPGCAADIALFDLERLQYAGAADPVAALIFCGFDHRAWGVIVNGEIVVDDGKLTCADEREIAYEANVKARALWKRASVL